MSASFLKHMGMAILYGVLVAAATSLLTLDIAQITDWRFFIAGFASKLIQAMAQAIITSARQ